MNFVRLSRAFCLAVATLSPLTALAQNLTPEQQAAVLLNGANRAFDDRQYPAAAERYKQYLAMFGGQKEVVFARHGLALCFIEGPQKDYRQAIDLLNQVAAVQDFAERPFTVYYLGLAHRNWGHDSLAQAVAKPNEAPQHKANAANYFTAAVKHFTDALPLLQARVKTPPTAEQVSPDADWVNRARCDLAEMLLRLEKPKEARDAIAAVATDPTLAKSRYRTTALYQHGHASYLLKEFLPAGRSLSQLAPFGDPVFGAHAQYLLARTHHLADERTEASDLYAATLKGYDQQKLQADQALKNPALLVDKPEEKARLEALVKAAPDYVARASFYSGVLLFEQQKYAEAAARFAPFAQQYAGSPLVQEAQLRLGFCQVESKQFGEALKTLQPLVQHPQLGDRALLWMGRAQVGVADPAQPPQYVQTLNTAVEWFKQASDRANQFASQDPEAKLRRAESLLEMADAMQLAKRHPEAVNALQTVLNENAIPDRTDEVLQRQATAMHLAQQWDPSDQVCVKFAQTYPKSVLMPEVLFRSAENAYIRATLIDPQNPNSQNPDLLKWFGESIKRYQTLLEKYPEFQFVSLARYRQALAHYRLGDFKSANTVLTAIAGPDRNGELSPASYYQADCVLRLLPLDTSDALAAGRQVQQLNEAIKLLDGFIGASQPTTPQLPDALLKAGYCYQLVAAQIAEPNERNQRLQAARAVYERIGQQHAQHPVAALAIFERAKVLQAQGDQGGAFNEFNRFKQAPLNGVSVAPLAWLRLAAILRAQNKAEEAVQTLAQARQQYEAAVVADPQRAAWAPLLQYHHGLAVKQTNKLPEARAVFEDLMKRFPTSPEAVDAAWRSGQCRREDALVKLTTARATIAKPGAKPEEINPALAAIPEVVKNLTETGQFYRDQAKVVGDKAKGSESHLRMHYEAAWCFQTLAELEIENARKVAREAALKKLADDLAKAGTPVTSTVGAAVPQLRVPEPTVASLPDQPSEVLLREQYQAILTAAPDAPLSLNVRLELAEVLARRDQHDPALKLLNEVLEMEPALPLEERVRTRIGASLSAKGQHKEAFEQFMAVAKNPQSASGPEARYRAGECQMQLGDFGQAIQILLPFRDQGPFQNVPGVSDRALLRLGHAFALAGQWEPSRQTLETGLGRFPQSAWRYDYRYGMGWALQNLKQFDPAVNVYNQVIAETASELGAKSLMNIGISRLEQKRHAEALGALLGVGYTYDYPEWSAKGLLEASRAYNETQQPRQATKVLERLMKEFPNTEAAKAAQAKLAGK